MAQAASGVVSGSWATLFSAIFGSLARVRVAVIRPQYKMEAGSVTVTRYLKVTTSDYVGWRRAAVVNISFFHSIYIGGTCWAVQWSDAAIDAEIAALKKAGCTRKDGATNGISQGKAARESWRRFQNGDLRRRIVTL
jgi:hypothetical protein